MEVVNTVEFSIRNRPLYSFDLYNLYYVFVDKNVNNKIYCLYNKIQIKDPISINCDMFIHQCNYEEDKIEVFRDLYINIENQDQESFILDIDDSEANNYMIIYFEKKQMEQLLSSLSNQSKKLKV